MNVKLIAAVLALSVALAGALWYAYETRLSLTAANVQVHALSTRVAALEKRAEAVQQNVNSTVQRSQANAQTLRAGITSAPEWAATRTPAPIVDGLCKFARCQAGEVRAPADRPNN